MPFNPVVYVAQAAGTVHQSEQWWLETAFSLEESDEEVATAWATELERRWREVTEGRVQTTSWAPRGPNRGNAFFARQRIKT